MKPMKRIPQRQCDRCGKVYHRCHRIRLWTTTNFGHRDGWGKLEQKICCRCMSGAESQDLAHVYLPEFITPPPRRKS